MKPIRRLILHRLLIIDNHLRKWITLFAMENGLHPKHRLTRYHDFFINNIQAGQSVLDVGCGEGYLARDVAKKASTVTGIDINQSSLERAKKIVPPNVTLIQGDATSHSFNNHFNVLILSNVLEHIVNAHKH